MTDFGNPNGLSAAEIAALNEDDDLDTLAPTERDEDAGYREEISSQTMMALAGQVSPPGELEASIQQLKQARDALEEEYADGDSDLTYAEHRAKLREMDAAFLDLTGDLAESRTLNRMAGKAAADDWERQIEAKAKEWGSI